MVIAVEIAEAHPFCYGHSTEVRVRPVELGRVSGEAVEKTA
jgi:hypothetical protein